MPVQLQHKNEVLLFLFEGAVTESDIRFAVEQFNTACDASTVPVNLIADTTKMMRFPPNILMLLKTQVAPFHHPNTGTIIVVTRSVVISKTVMFLCRLVPFVAIQMAHSLDEACKQMERVTHVTT